MSSFVLFVECCFESSVKFRRRAVYNLIVRLGDRCVPYRVLASVCPYDFATHFQRGYYLFSVDSSGSVVSVDFYELPNPLPSSFAETLV